VVKKHGDTAFRVTSFFIPFTVLVIIPVLLLMFTRGFRFGWGLGLPYNAIVICIGSVTIMAGLCLLIATNVLFISIGKGTLAPWAPPKKLVVNGPYRYVRNPMISSVLMVLLGESIVFGSMAILIWFVVFFFIDHMYFVLWEEPELVKRFGDDYLQYKNNVPRWIPRLSPWKNGGGDEDR